MMGSSQSSSNNKNSSNTSSKISKKVDIIFSDKTGTLTKNVFVLSQCLVGEQIFGNLNDQKNEKPNFHINGDERGYEILNSDDYDYLESLEKNPLKAKLIEFLWISSMCHSIFAEKDEISGDVKYQTDHKGDFSLIQAAKEMGYVLNKRTADTIEVFNEHKKKTESWEILYEIPFESRRKRETIFVKNKDNVYENSVFIFSKGAPEEMLNMMNLSEVSNSFVKDAIHKFTCDGMRTLGLGMKAIKLEEFSDWHSKIKTLNNSENNEETKERKLNQHHNEMEYNLNFTGISALEDTLQDEVFDTIKALLKSGIKFWIVTGDRKEATLITAKKCGLIDENKSNEFIHINDTDNAKEIENQLNTVINELKITELNDFQKLKTMETKKNYVLSIEGISLTPLFENENLFLKFLKVAIVCKFVFFYRMSPIVKMNIMKETKKLTKLVTLCIGESDINIPMMMEADIKVGIKGEDGTRLTSIANYAVEEFKNLKDLLTID